MQQRTITWSDALAATACGLIASSVLAMQVTLTRSLAERESCSNNLKRIGLATHNYHSAYKQMPMGSGGTGPGKNGDPRLGNANRLSAFVALTPFLEEQKLWWTISNPLATAQGRFPPMGPVPWYDPKQYRPWGQRPAIYVCPQDADAEKYPLAASYVLNYGDAVIDVGAPVTRDMPPYEKGFATKRGAFMRERPMKFRDFLDGLSNSLLISEAKIAGTRVAKDVEGLALNPSACFDVQNDGTTSYWPQGRSACWADGSLRSVGFQTILPPNSPSATSAKGELEGVMSASSYHTGGTHVLFADGKVNFITDSIDSGEVSAPSVAASRDDGYAPPGSRSPYGLWGALGTRASKEIVRVDLDPNILAPREEYTPEQVAQVEALPLETWTLANGTTTLEARQIDLQRESTVVLLTESGDTKWIALSDLSSRDAYRAVKRVFDVQAESVRELKAEVVRAIELLEQRKYEAFAKEFMDSSDAKIVETVATQRGIYLFSLDATQRQLTGEQEFNLPKRLPGLSFDMSGNRIRLKVHRSWQ